MRHGYTKLIPSRSGYLCHGTTAGQRLAFKALVWCSHALSGWHERLELGSMEPT